MDDPFVACPYNQKHRVPRSRIQAHLVKCQEKYPTLQTCPYNATHRFSAELIKEHVRECSSRRAVFPEAHPLKVIASISKPKPILQKEYLPESDPNHELWDEY